MTDNFPIVCRLCLSGEGSLEDIFKCEDLNVWILDLLSIVVSKDDKISRSICAGCRRRLHEFREYQLRCLEVQDVLLRKSIGIEGDFKQHTVLVHEEQQQTTEADAPVVRKGSRFSRQENDSSSSKKVTCSICDKKVFQYRLEGHQNKHQGLRPFKCERGCEDVDFNCRYNRQHHYRNVHGGEQHECGVCHKAFRNKACLYYHKKGVHAPKSFTCPVCNKAFSASSRLIAHKKLHGTRERKYPCSLCSLSFFSKHILQIHMKTHRRRNVRGQKNKLADADQAVAGEDKFRGKELQIGSDGTNSDPEQSNDDRKDDSMPGEERELCSICDKIFPKVRMEGHQNWHQGLRPFECERGCVDVDFHCQQKRLQHYRKVHDRHECDICHNIFRSRKTLRTHKQGVHAPKTFECSACIQKFTTLDRLKMHTKLVHDCEKNRACPKCSKMFCFGYELNRHMKSHGIKKERRRANLQVVGVEKMVKLEPEADPELFQADMQDDSSSMAMEEEMKIEPKSNIKQPVKVQQTAEKVKCQKCGKKFLEKGMEAHLNMHAGLRPYKCEYGCEDEGFRSGRSRQIHYQKVHEKIVCDICHKTFQSQSSLRGHIRYVHTAKDLTCSCGKAFSKPYHLQRHINQVHNGVKDQCCPICGKDFARKYDVTRHMETHKGEESSELEDLFEAEEVKIEPRDDDNDYDDAPAIGSIKEEM